ncbi:BrnA antitoxin family protein [Peptococcaceae bacterium]|nr:BrnA antitoxin family protein [Peptococcaceae bacterium]
MNKSSLSKVQTYQDIGRFWDKNDLADYWEETKLAEFEVDIQSEVIYYAVDSKLSGQIIAIAKRHGVPANKLLNSWVQEKLQQ